MSQQRKPDASDPNGRKNWVDAFVNRIEDNDAAQSLLFNGLSKSNKPNLIFNRYVCIENTTQDFQNTFNTRGSLNS